MKQGGKRSLEGYKIFPYVAWGLIVVFTVFVYNLTREVSEATKQLQSAQSQIFNVAQVETNLER